jgi:TrmH family RNA methyltransferase
VSGDFQDRVLDRIGRHGARLKELRRRARERRSGEVVVDGRRLLDDLVRWGVPLLELYVAEGFVASPGLERLLAAAGEAFAVGERALAEVAPTRQPQGLLAVVAEPRLEPWSRRDGVALYLDRVQDPGNVGALVRSAAALGAEAVLLSPGSADPFHPAAVRASAGAVFRLPVERDRLLAELAAAVRRNRGEVWLADTSGVPVGGWQPRRPVVVVVGTEGGGLGAEARTLADGAVTIPVEREVESLNVSVAAALLLEALRRQGPAS